MHPWPFLEATTTGTAPLTISDLRQILYVVDTTSNEVVKPLDQRTVRDIDPDLESSGQPERWYLEGTTTLAVWPPNTSNSLSVRYLKVPADLTGTDSTVVPARYEYLIVDLAAAMAYRDSDNFDAAQALQSDISLEIEDMARTLLNRNYAGPEYILNVAPPTNA